MKTTTQQITRAARKLKRQYDKGLCAAPTIPQRYANSAHAWKRAARWHITELRRAEKLAVRRFYNAVCEKAEANMLKTGKLEGSHYAAMRELLP